MEKAPREDNRGMVTAQFLGQIPEDQVGPVFLIEPSLRRLLDAVDLYLGQEDPTPPRVEAEIIKIDLPEVKAFAQPDG